MSDIIDTDALISIVQQKPALWDKTLEIFSDRNAKKNAWREVCEELNNDYEIMSDSDKNIYLKSIMNKWANLRDCFKRSMKNTNGSKKSGSGASRVQKYVFHDALSFLSKVYQSTATVDSFNSADDFQEDSEIRNLEFSSQNMEMSQGMEEDSSMESQKKSKFVNKKRRVTKDEFEAKLLKALESDDRKSNPHMSFFQGVIPHLEKFSSEEVLQFQMGVLQLISTINERKNYQAPNPFSLMQPPTYNTPSPFQSQTYIAPNRFSSTNSPSPQRQTSPHPSTSFSFFDNNKCATIHQLPQIPTQAPLPVSLLRLIMQMILHI
ncbi:uncharacterized protein LOC122512050 [Leptopilina heterotoma]|uniref:uncharacterized protein LOC122512050 n=1 Tax=Leptopilina heterotoma TaxID=63436 RepID=UPI001CA83109|nr:uncharacterized protein LOC122512050 [Leptopilina heterotoma]